MNLDSSSERQHGARAALPRPAKPPHRILVVEDDSDIRQLNTEVLTQCGFQVDTAKDGATAWNTLQHKGYDLLLTDNEMPGATGVDLLKKLHAAHLALPVIMATEILPLDEFNRQPWLQPAAMLTKPYTVDELVGKVKEVLRVALGSGEQIEPPRTWQNQLPPEGWRLS